MNQMNFHENNREIEQFTELAHSLRPTVDRFLKQYGAPEKDCPPDDPSKIGGCPDRLREAMHYSLLSPGKRLRPILVLLGSRACGGADDVAMPAACAVEMIHAYSLVHDDLPAMDDDDLRRGRPTCHRKFGEALAILTGDALLTRAFELLARDTRPPEIAARAVALLGEAAGASQLVGGQVDDIAVDEATPSLELLEAIHRRKTGALIEVSLKLGGLVAGGTTEQLDALSTYGRHVGLAFQIIDDLLDECSDEETMGKAVDKDAAQGKLTFPSLLGIDESRARASRLIDDAIGAIHAVDSFCPEGAGPLIGLARYVIERNR